MRHSVFQKIEALEMNGFEIYLELFAKAKRRGLKIEEYPEKFCAQNGLRRSFSNRDCTAADSKYL